MSRIREFLTRQANYVLDNIEETKFTRIKKIAWEEQTEIRSLVK